eukprot:8705026-Ditylum_brightwellii.AAC.1
MAMSLLSILEIQEQCTQHQIKFDLILFHSYDKICIVKITAILSEDIVNNALNRWNNIALRGINAIILFHLAHWHIMNGQGNVY